MSSNPLYQKSVLFVGDSLCEAACELKTEEYAPIAGWAGRIIRDNEMSGLNKSCGGASMSDCRGWNIVINQLIAMTGNDYDYVILEGGGNDALCDLLRAAQACALTPERLDTRTTEGYDGSLSMMHRITLTVGSSDIRPFLAFLSLDIPRATVLGLYRVLR